MKSSIWTTQSCKNAIKDSNLINTCCQVKKFRLGTKGICQQHDGRRKLNLRVTMLTIFRNYRSSYSK